MRPKNACGQVNYEADRDSLLTVEDFVRTLPYSLQNRCADKVDRVAHDVSEKG